MNKIKKNDEVIVLAGRDKGRRGRVLKWVNENYVTVDGVFVAKKATKGNPMTGVTGGIVNKLLSIHVSNVALVNDAIGKADGVGFKVVDGKKVRIFKSSGEVVKA